MVFKNNIYINFTHVTISADLARISSITKTKLVSMGTAAMVVVVGSRGDHFLFGFYLKNNQTEFIF